jgi:hypothetical protein
MGSSGVAVGSGVCEGSSVLLICAGSEAVKHSSLAAEHWAAQAVERR